MSLRFIAIYFALLTAFAGNTLSAQTDVEIDKAVAAAKGAPRNQALNLEAGEMLMDAGRLHEAIPYFQKAGNRGNLNLAELYFLLYDYDEADKYLERYLSKRTKADESKDKEFSYNDSAEPSDWAEVLQSRIDLGRSMLDRVEKIQIIDSINVPVSDFYKFYKLASSAGYLVPDIAVEKYVDSATLERYGITDVGTPAFVSESGDEIVWYGFDNIGNSSIFETLKLSDGTAETQEALFDYKSIFGNSNGSLVSYPFLASDGVTLYFAADGENSLGDLDIFISRKDGEGFLQPSNIGMPYNSPYNDYLYVIDEQNGVGWWATDRNQISDSVTIYTFIPQDLRINYPVDTPDLTSYARISSIKATQNQEIDIAGILKRINSRERETGERGEHRPLFDFALPDGRILHSFSDFTNRMAAKAMQEYLDNIAKTKTLESNIVKLRQRYSNGDRSVSSMIINAEKELSSAKEELMKQKNHIVTLESDFRN